MRAFIGLKLNDCLSDILNIQKEIKDLGANANYTLPNNIHITLSFLGEINQEREKLVKEIMDDLTIKEFSIVLNKIHTFKNMIVLELEPNQSLKKLQSYLESKLIENGFNIEKRKFYPHITLARKINFQINKDINIISEVKECILFSSDRINNTLTYTPKHKILFGGKNEKIR